MQHTVVCRLVLSACILLCGGCNVGLPNSLAAPPRFDAGSPVDAGRDADSDGPVYVLDASHPLRDAGGPDAASDAAPPDAEKTGCGDGKWQAGEACDDGNALDGDGCSADCTRVEKDFTCPGPGAACILSVVCGDGRVQGQETCDDGNKRDSDGCSATCTLERGFVCVTAARPCSAAACGDGILAGEERCDDGNKTSQDGCSELCDVEAGFACPTANMACHKTVCNDGVKEGSEPCDDGNQVVGDGCTPFCEVEPDCSAGACRSRCGDGLSLPDDAEECDDGNTVDHDGCSAQCKVEQGYTCTRATTLLPEVLKVPVTYRDLVALPNSASPSHPTRHPDFEFFAGTGISPLLVKDTLGPNGKPVSNGRCDSASVVQAVCPYGQQLTTQQNFAQWYTDVPGVNVSKVEQMQLARDAASGAYKIQNSAFFPWDGDSRSLTVHGLSGAQDAAELTTLGSDNRPHDFGFTSEVRTYFEFTLDAQHPPVLTFAGDDDVWVFINHKLAVDIGGLHLVQQASVTLDAAKATALGLESGKIYEIALFHAERHSTASNFNLTLNGFVSAHTSCDSKCGDGVMVGHEQCDDGKNDGSYGSCTSDCQPGPHCGDGVVQSPQEACDDGVNITTYGTGGKPACAPGCKLSAYCGDGALDSLAGEECDERVNTGDYGHCRSDCKRGPRCGDHVVQSDQGEICDDGNLINGDGCSNDCLFESPG